MIETHSEDRSKSTVLVTGANGFIGSELCAQLFGKGYRVRAAMRPARYLTLPLPKVTVAAVDRNTDWAGALVDVDTVIHLAGLTRVHNSRSRKALDEFHLVNVEGTMNLARQAAALGIRRFIFISSIKVHGECTSLTQAFSEMDEPAPEDAYAQSKLEAERGLLKLATGQSMEIVIIRPPLVYGAGVKGNLLSLMRCLDIGLPLPLGRIQNKRTLVALDTLVDLIMTCIWHPAAANRIILAGDSEDLSTSELLQRLAGALGKKARFLPVPAKMINGCLRLFGKRSLALRLFGSLRVDTSNTCNLLGWKPPVGVDEALRKTGLAYLRKKP